MQKLLNIVVVVLFIVCFSKALTAKPLTEPILNDWPVIKFNRESVDLGKVKEGVVIYRSFKVKNIGRKVLKILETKSTCGCTVPDIKRNILSPGESTILKVLIDTSMKQNKVIKTLDVFSNDPARSKVVLSFSMDVENRHKNLSEGGKSKILSDEKCMTCHVYNGVGTFGKDLYEADCAMCHGEKGEGATGPNLLMGGYKVLLLAERRRKIIACGSNQSNAMPGFEYTCGGPLSSEQIDSLIEYLKKLSEEKNPHPGVEQH